MRKSRLAALLIGFTTLGGCAKVRYPDYYVLNLPNPVAAPRDAEPGVTTADVRELKQVFESAELYDGRTGAEFLLTGSLDQRSLPAVVAEMSRDLSEAATQLVSSMRRQVSPSSFRANNE